MQYYAITGTLKGTSLQPSPYSFFSLTRKHGLREMWDSEHAAFYGKETKHAVADYIKPVGICVDSSGATFVRCCFVDQLGIEHYADIDTIVVRDDPKFVAHVLKSLFGFNVYNDLFPVFGRALTVLRLEDEEHEPDSGDGDSGESEVGVSVYQHFDGYPLISNILYETGEFNYIDFYHIVDPLTMNDGKPAKHESQDETTDVEGEAEGSESGEGSEADGDAEGSAEGSAGTGDSGEGQVGEGEGEGGDTVPMPEIVIHAGYAAKAVRPGFVRQMSEEEE